MTFNFLGKRPPQFVEMEFRLNTPEGKARAFALKADHYAGALKEAADQIKREWKIQIQNNEHEEECLCHTCHFRNQMKRLERMLRVSAGDEE